MNYSVVALTPYFNELPLKTIDERMRVLQLLDFIFKAGEISAKLFILGRYRDFDAQVSENLCQVRAYQIVSLIDSKNFLKNKKELDNFLKVIKKAQKKCQEALIELHSLKNKRPSHYTKLIDQAIPLVKILALYNLEVEYSELSYFLTQSYILSNYKLVEDFDISHGINYDKLCHDIKISSKTYLRKIIHCFQRNISKLSCQFIFRLAGMETNLNKLHLLKTLHYKDEIGRYVLPCYEVTRIILNHALATRKYVKVIAIRIFNNIRDEIEFSLQPDSDGEYYVYSPKGLEENDKEIIVFKGRMSYKEGEDFETKKEYIRRFLRFGFVNIILANMAQHPQYAGILLNEIKFNPYSSLNFESLPRSYVRTLKESEQQFMEDKKSAEQLGCTPINSNLFLLTHVYCDNAANNYTILNEKMKKPVLTE